jgi:UDP-N-acetylglucosamine 2-epimerase (non-hydrolysing)
MQKCKIISVVGARPNFMKIAPFIKAIEKHNAALQTTEGKVEHLLVHTGQHYDVRMSESFFKDLGIPNPDINLEVGSGSHAEQVGKTMIAFEKVLKEYKPDWVVVVGDVNATLACSVTAKKECIKVCHIEAGLRSGDLTMPEEINRLVTDRLSDLLLTPDEISSENLRKEGVAEEKIRFIGNIMIDTLEDNRAKAEALDLGQILNTNKSDGSNANHPTPTDKDYIAMTLHRPSNVDKKEVLEPLVDFLLTEVSKEFKLVWTVHPRTRKQLITFGLWNKIVANQNVILLEPLGYHEMLKVTMGARLMMTDSGGLQEECCVLGIPCLTMRWNTERPVTLMEYGGASILVGNDIALIRKAYHNAISQETKPSRPLLWDGHTAERCLEEILKAHI